MKISPLALIEKQIEDSIAVKREFFARQSADMIRSAECLGECLRKGGKLLVCGNGGSASDAQHFSGEMIGRFLKERRALPAIALSTDTSVITAVGNDYGYEKIFRRQVEGLGRAGDILFAISTSGNSPNVLEAVAAARALDMQVIALTGGNGGKLGALADIHLNVALGKNSPRVQETHIAVIHLLVDLLDEFYLSN